MKQGLGKIEIKESHKGLFTKYCGGKVTQECIDKGKKSSNLTTKKRAIFTENAKKWNR